MDTVKDPFQKLTVLDSLISKSRGNDMDDFIAYSQTFIEYATSVDSVAWAAKKVINVSYSLVSLKNDPQTALTIIDKLLLQKEKHLLLSFGLL